MTEPDDVLKTLGELKEELEHVNLQQMAQEPKKQKQLAGLIDSVNKAIAEVKASQRIEQSNELLVALFKEIRQQTAVANERLKYVEATLTGGNGSPFPAKKEILEEGEWLKGMLAGPPSDDVDPQLLKDAPRYEIPSGLSLLAQGLATTSKTSMKSTKP